MVQILIPVLLPIFPFYHKDVTYFSLVEKKLKKTQDNNWRKKKKKPSVILKQTFKESCIVTAEQKVAKRPFLKILGHCCYKCNKLSLKMYKTYIC